MTTHHTSLEGLREQVEGVLLDFHRCYNLDNHKRILVNNILRIITQREAEWREREEALRMEGAIEVLRMMKSWASKQEGHANFDYTNVLSQLSYLESKPSALYTRLKSPPSPAKDK